MSTGLHTTLRGSFENVVIVLTPVLFIYILPGDQETFFNACSTLCPSAGLLITVHYKLTCGVNKPVLHKFSLSVYYCQSICSSAFASELVVLLVNTHRQSQEADVITIFILYLIISIMYKGRFMFSSQIYCRTNNLDKHSDSLLNFTRPNFIIKNIEATQTDYVIYKMLFK